MLRSRVTVSAALAILLLIGVVAMRADDDKTRGDAHEQPELTQLLEADLALLLQDYGPDHPKVRRVRYQLDYLREQQGLQSARSRYSIAANANSFVLVDSVSGSTWILDTVQGAGNATWKALPTLPNP